MWGITESFSDITLAPGQSIYLLIDAQNVFSGPAMFVGEFHLSGKGFTFANGTTTLLTDTTHWLTSEAGFAGAAAAPASHGANATLPIWGALPGISGDAEAIWAYYADWSTGYNGHAYFVAQITAVPEPGSALMFGAGLAALALVARRRNRG